MKSRRTACILSLLLLALLCCFGARAYDRSDALLSERLSVPDDGETYEFVFSPTTNNVYTFQSFGNPAATAALYLDEEETPIFEMVGFEFDARLIADATYRLVVTSNGAPCEVEIMRAALGRSFGQPIELTDLEAGYDKAIARAYDTHFFRFTAPVTGIYVIRSSSAFNTVGYLLDEHGERLAVSDNLYSPYSLDFRIQYTLTEGETYYVRVCGRGEEIGTYRLIIAEPTPGQELPDALQLSTQSLSLAEGETARLTYAVSPQGAIDDAVFITTNPDVVTVTPMGEVVARGVGGAQIVLSGPNGTEARCTIEVTPIAVTALELDDEAIEMHVDDTAELGYRVLPDNASNAAVSFESSAPDVVAVDGSGRLLARATGEATIRVTTADGGFTQEAHVRVLRARSQYRVLVMGEQRYVDDEVRTGAINTAQGVADLFGRQKYDGVAPEVTVLLDSTRSQASVAIRKAFENAQPTDVSILYINSHGGLTGREAWIKFHDGSRMTAPELERLLRQVKGKVVLLLDCCQSGAFLSREAALQFDRRMLQAFTASSGAHFSSSKYYVLTSASSTQNSYRISTSGERTESSMATVFGRSLTEAGGWDLIGDKATSMRADLNQDQQVTLYEAYLYTQRAVNSYLVKSGVRQDVQIKPAGAQLVLFAQ